MHFIVSYVYENNVLWQILSRLKILPFWKTLHAAFFLSLLFSAYFPRKRSNKLFKICYPQSPMSSPRSRCRMSKIIRNCNSFGLLKNGVWRHFEAMVTRKYKANLVTKRRAHGIVFKYLRFEKRFRKVHFQRRVSVKGRPKFRNKAAFPPGSSFLLNAWN